jgi:acetylglutamate kinase
MIPKLETCIDAVEGGVDAAVILDGRVPHAMLIEIFTKRAPARWCDWPDRRVASAHPEL